MNHLNESKKPTYSAAKTVMPQLASMDRASGAFGNSGVNEVRTDSMKNLAETLGNVSNQMRYQNYADSARLAESGLSRDSALPL